MNDDLDPLRKAAVLLTSLDTESADALLAQMPADKVAEVLEIQMVLGEIEPAERDAVIEEFFLTGQEKPLPTVGNEESTVEQSLVCGGVEISEGLKRRRHLREQRIGTLCVEAR